MISYVDKRILHAELVCILIWDIPLRCYMIFRMHKNNIGHLWLWIWIRTKTDFDLPPHTAPSLHLKQRFTYDHILFLVTFQLISKAEKIIMARAKEANKHIRFQDDCDWCLTFKWDSVCYFKENCSLNWLEALRSKNWLVFVLFLHWSPKMERCYAYQHIGSVLLHLVFKRKSDFPVHVNKIWSFPCLDVVKSGIAFLRYMPFCFFK